MLIPLETAEVIQAVTNPRSSVPTSRVYCPQAPSGEELMGAFPIHCGAKSCLRPLAPLTLHLAPGLTEALHLEYRCAWSPTISYARSAPWKGKERRFHSLAGTLVSLLPLGGWCALPGHRWDVLHAPRELRWPSGSHDTVPIYIQNRRVSFSLPSRLLKGHPLAHPYSLPLAWHFCLVQQWHVSKADPHLHAGSTFTLEVRSEDQHQLNQGKRRDPNKQQG